MEEKQFTTILDRLDKLIKLMASQSLGDKTGKEAIALLSGVGFQPKEIADFLGTSPNTVSVTLSQLKRKKRKGNAKKD